MEGRIVYSTEQGKMCPDCAKAVRECECLRIKKAVLNKGEGIAQVRYETKGRKGKGVTVITGLALSLAGLEQLARSLKQRLGAGGTVQAHTIELQGDHRVCVKQELEKQGYKVR
jgi:translation initiation factor 1